MAADKIVSKPGEPDSNVVIASNAEQMKDFEKAEKEKVPAAHEVGSSVQLASSAGAKSVMKEYADLNTDPDLVQVKVNGKVLDVSKESAEQIVKEKKGSHHK